MRAILAAAVLGLACGLPGASQAQGPIPPGSYQRYCRDISMNDIYLTAWCQGPRGSGRSTINVRSCGGDIGVDPQGGLVCAGPGGGYPDYPPPDRPYPGDRPYPDDGWRPPHSGREPVAILYEGRRFKGRSFEVYGEISNLDRTGFNDRVGSIRFGRRSGPWEICTDSKFRGRCRVVRDDVRDARDIGMWNAISSLRALR